MKFLFAVLLVGIIGFVAAEEGATPAESQAQEYLSDLSKKIGDVIKNADPKITALWEKESNSIYSILNKVHSKFPSAPTEDVANFHKSIRDSLFSLRQLAENKALGALGQGSVPKQ